MALSNRSKLFLHKLKAQYGLNVPYMDDNTFMPVPTEESINPERGLKTMQYSPSLIQPKEVQENPLDQIGKFTPLISPLIKVGMGVAGMIQGAQERKRQRAYERNSMIDYKQRREDARANNFYQTPYTVGRSDDLTRKKGGSVYQQGGLVDPMNSFMDFYNQQQNAIQQSLDMLKEGYENKNEQLKQQWKQKKSEGISNIIGGGLGIAQALFQQGGELTKEEVRADSLRRQNLRDLRPQQKYNFPSGINPLKTGSGKSKSKDRYREKQEGGEIEQTPDTESLYSKDFQSPWDAKDLVEQATNEDRANDPGGHMQYKESLFNWLFEEPEQKQYYDIDELYTKVYGKSSSLPIQSTVDKLKSMGLNPSSVEGGRHNTGSKHYSGNALDLGLNTSFGGDTNKMNQFYDFLNSDEGKRQFPGIKVVDERNRPAGQQVWSGSHLHLELI